MDRLFHVAQKAVIMRLGHVLLIRRAGADQYAAGTWECPGGKVEFGEQLPDALIREIKEETGLHARVGPLLYASTFLRDEARQLVVLTYRCFSPEGEITLSDEHDKYCWADEDRARELLTGDVLADFQANAVFALIHEEGADG